MAGLEGGMGAALVGAVGGLLALGPESALPMVAAVWLEYPESLCMSLGKTSSLPRSAEGERFAATLAVGAGDVR